MTKGRRKIRSIGQDIERWWKVNEVQIPGTKNALYRAFLDSLGMRPRKVGMRPATGDAKKQDACKKKMWSRDCQKHKLAKEASIVWRPPILSVPPCLDISGH
jgi:hypothetical protein